MSRDSSPRSPTRKNRPESPNFWYETVFNSDIKFYYLDSANFDFMDLSDREILPAFN